jgi:transposase InsO family protein
LLREVELTKKAKFRLEVLDFYYNKSKRFSWNGKPNAKLTCRHFGIHRSYFYRWLKRYDKKRIASLENRSTTPVKKQTARYTRALVKAVREIREENPTYSGKKIRPILLRTLAEEEVPSEATLGRLIRRERLFFRADTSRRKKHSNSAKKAHQRLRKPYNLSPQDGCGVVEFDMKHVYLLGTRLYAFCALYVSRREAVIHVASSPSSLNAKTAIQKAVSRWGKNICIVNDNGSENMAKVEEYLRELEITQYWTRPHRPKDKPFVERFIGTLQRECLDYNYEPMNVRELSCVVDSWLDKYHHYRPHEALKGMTPAQFSDTLGLSIPSCRFVL